LEVNEKDYRNIIISIGIFAIILIFTGSIVGYYIGRADTGDNPGVESNISRERELLSQIGEYRIREEERNRREAERIAAERERFERTENAIGALRGFDRRSDSLHQQIEQEVEILASFFRDSRDLINNGLDNTGSE
jgi:hypothetical protein